MIKLVLDVKTIRNEESPTVVGIGYSLIDLRESTVFYSGGDYIVASKSLKDDDLLKININPNTYVQNAVEILTSYQNMIINSVEKTREQLKRTGSDETRINHVFSNRIIEWHSGRIQEYRNSLKLSLRDSYQKEFEWEFADNPISIRDLIYPRGIENPDFLNEIKNTTSIYHLKHVHPNKDLMIACDSYNMSQIYLYFVNYLK